MNKDRLRRTSLNYEIENHCTSAMLVEVIRSVKQRSRAWFREKKAHWPWKNACATVWKVLMFFQTH